MSYHGIPKAPYRAFQLLHMLGSEIYAQTLSSGTVDGWAVAKPEANAIQFLMVNHHSLLHPIREERIQLTVKGGGRCVAAEVRRVDDTHANALTQWEKMGQPEYLTKAQEYALLAASQLQREALPIAQREEETIIELDMPPMGTALVTVYFE